MGARGRIATANWKSERLEAIKKLLDIARTWLIDLFSSWKAL